MFLRKITEKIVHKAWWRESDKHVELYCCQSRTVKVWHTTEVNNNNNKKNILVNGSHENTVHL